MANHNHRDFMLFSNKETGKSTDAFFGPLPPNASTNSDSLITSGEDSEIESPRSTDLQNGKLGFLGLKLFSTSPSLTREQYWPSRYFTVTHPFQQLHQHRQEGISQWKIGPAWTYPEGRRTNLPPLSKFRTTAKGLSSRSLIGTLKSSPKFFNAPKR